MKNDNNVQFLCKDCEYYNNCVYCHSRKKESYICKYFHLSNKIDNIKMAIDNDEYTFTDANGLRYIPISRVYRIINKYKWGVDDGN